MQAAGTSSLLRPTKSLYKGGIAKRGHRAWQWRDELTKERLLCLLCVLLLPVSVGLSAAGIASQDLVANQGDGLNTTNAQLGYSRLCYTGDELPQDCSAISSGCQLSFSAATQQYQLDSYGAFDTQLDGCTEFNAYRAFHVMGIILAGSAFIAMSLTYLRLVPPASLTRVKIVALELAFASGCSGAVAHCLFIDWWNSNQQHLVSLGYAAEYDPSDYDYRSSTPSYVVLQQSFFDLVGGWVAAIASALLYVFHFQSASSK